jgi:hypothetical protein
MVRISSLGIDHTNVSLCGMSLVHNAEAEQWQGVAVESD